MQRKCTARRGERAQRARHQGLAACVGGEDIIRERRFMKHPAVLEAIDMHTDAGQESFAKIVKHDTWLVKVTGGPNAKNGATK